MKTKYINDVGMGLTQVLMETDNAGAVQAVYTYGNDLISMYRSGANSYYHYDGLGTTRQMTNSSGAVVASYTYDGFGNSVSSVSFYEARPVKFKICLIGSTFYPSFRQAFSLFTAVSFNLCDNAYS
ncbi:MAG: hypothetical protein ABFD79_02190, partial [Phycisphaerales bacterium]